MQARVENIADLAKDGPWQRYAHACICSFDHELDHKSEHMERIASIVTTCCESSRCRTQTSAGGDNMASLSSLVAVPGSAGGRLPRPELRRSCAREADTYSRRAAKAARTHSNSNRIHLCLPCQPLDRSSDIASKSSRNYSPQDVASNFGASADHARPDLESLGTHSTTFDRFGKVCPRF